jgi:lipopolysaccharide transport system ATP-binding protein
MSDIIITVENLSKRYVIGHKRSNSDGLRHVIEAAMRAPFKWLRSSREQKRHQREEFWALNDVSLEVKQGEAVGIIGRNGAGKSTLLKILSRITEPTLGQIHLKGRIASLLEVGTGFHPELTGRENIFLNGAILGMTRAEIKRKFDEIVAFAEVEKFLDTPVKRYSSGMYVRLAFAVAAHLEPEILLVDEVLAVGDAAFQRKCMGKMGQVAKGGRTILFVSHNMGAILRLCNRCIWLRDGKVQAQGGAREVVNAYTADGTIDEAARSWSEPEAPGDDAVKLISVRICQPSGVPNAAINITQPFDLVVETEFLKCVPEATTGLRVLTADGQIVFHTTAEMNPNLRVSRPGRWQYVCRMPAYALNTGTYFLNVGVTIPFVRTIFSRENVLRWTVEALSTEMGRYGARDWHGILGPGLGNWSVEEIRRSDAAIYPAAKSVARLC